MYHFAPKALWPDFQEDNSWIIKNDNEESCSYHIYCSKCGFYHIKKSKL
jgi:hypothetical protein